MLKGQGAQGQPLCGHPSGTQQGHSWGSLACHRGVRGHMCAYFRARDFQRWEGGSLNSQRKARRDLCNAPGKNLGVPPVPPWSSHAPWSTGKGILGAPHKGARGLEEETQPRLPCRDASVAERDEGQYHPLLRCQKDTWLLP